MTDIQTKVVIAESVLTEKQRVGDGGVGVECKAGVLTKKVSDGCRLREQKLLF